jgi:hypothetical protein
LSQFLVLVLCAPLYGEYSGEPDIQFMHPLMSLIMESRGGILGAFNTENQEALKLLLHLSMAR